MRRTFFRIATASLAAAARLTAQSPSASLLGLRPPIASLPEGFEHISSVRELNDGRLIIADDSRHSRLLVADWRSGRVSVVGREGDGPGEYRSIGQVVALPSDSSLVTDPRGGRWLLLDGLRVAGMAAHNGLRLQNAQVPFGADGRGRILELEAHVFPKSREPVARWYPNAESLFVLVVRRGSSNVDTVARIRGRYRGIRHVPSPKGGQVAGMSIIWDLVNPLAAEDQALLFPDGWVAIAYGNPFQVEWVAPDGKRVRSGTLPGPTRTIDEREKRNALLVYRPTYLSAGFGVNDVPTWPAVLPPFPINALLAVPDGALAIERTAEASSPGRVYDIVDRTGHVVKRIRLLPNERLVGFGSHAAFVAAKDSDDIEWLRKHPWP
jgi:hypothetical protein